MSLVLVCPSLSSEEACTGDVMFLCYHYVNAQEGGPGEDVSGILLVLMGRNHAPNWYPHQEETLCLFLELPSWGGSSNVYPSSQGAIDKPKHRSIRAHPQGTMDN